VVRIVQLEPGPISSDVRSVLESGPLFLAAPDPQVEARLRTLGLSPQPVTSEVPDGAVLVLPRRPLDELAHTVDRLLGPGGCPWDQAQTHETLKKHLIEEAYEVLDAIDSGSPEKLREELGDLLLQPMMHAQIRKLRTGEFDIDAVAQEINEKLVRRHPHVFGDVDVADADEVLRNWDRIKQQEKGPSDEGPKSILAGVPKAMPSLLRAHEVSKRAVRVGFEWPDVDAVFDKMREEEAELREAIAGGDQDDIASEIGDLLFTIVNVARWAKVEPEEALRTMVDRFTRRFMTMERLSVKELRDLSPEEWDELWNRAKAEERA